MHGCRRKVHWVGTRIWGDGVEYFHNRPSIPNPSPEIYSNGKTRVPWPLNLSHIWTHPGLQGQFHVTARRITTARIYTACHVRTRVPHGLDGFRALPPQQFDDL